MKTKKLKKAVSKAGLEDYQEQLLQELEDPAFASEYLNAALADEDPRIFLVALKNVCEAQGTEMTALSRETKLSRENLYRMLSKKGNPRLSSIVSVLSAVGFSLAVSPNGPKR